MPNREEIAGWLRDRATELFRKAKRLENDFGQKDACINRAQLWETCSLQVEQMRCENCSELFKVTGIGGEGIPCPWSGSNGCWNFKPNV